MNRVAQPPPRLGQTWQTTDRRVPSRRFVVLGIFGRKALVEYEGGDRRTIRLDRFRRKKWYVLVEDIPGGKAG